MSVKDQFSPQEWFKVMNGPGQAGAAVVAASPSGLTGLVAEAQAIGQAIRQSVSASPRTPLLEAMAADLLGTPPNPKDFGAEPVPRDMKAARDQSLEGVRGAMWLVSSKLGAEDADAYRRMLLNVAEQAAGAAKEGGFLGMGGEQVNAAEREVIAELRRLLGAPEEAAPATPTEPGAGLS